MKPIYTAKSDVNGNGLFTVEDIEEGEIIGVSHVCYKNYWYSVNPIGIYYNHSLNPNCIIRYEGNLNLLVAKINISAWEELLVDYTKQSHEHFEQPKEDWLT